MADHAEQDPAPGAEHAQAHHTEELAEVPHPVEEETEEAAPEAPPGDEDPLCALQAERDQLYERLQRLSAEFDNFQKRIRRERAKWADDSIRGLLESMLPVLDNIDYAIAAFDKEVKDPASLRQGVELVREELLRQLASNGVTPIEVAAGGGFDSEQHQAISLIPDDEVSEEQIAFVARKGYRLGEHVLRPAQVGVKKPAS